MLKMFNSLSAKDFFMVKGEDQVLERLLYLSKRVHPDISLLL